MSRAPGQTRERPTPAEVGRSLAFPFARVRSGQDVMLRDVEGALESGLTLLVAAPAGIGKTAAALYPALRLALRDDRRVFFVTAKGSQQQLALATLRRMIEPGSGVCAVQITAKEKTCPLDGRRCRDHRCRYLERFSERLERSGLVEELAGRGVIEGATIMLRALERRLCPFEVSLALAERAHVVVSDLNYVFEPTVYLRRFFDTRYDRHLLIVDEAHNLPARAAGYYSPELEVERLRATAHACFAQTDPLFAAAGLPLAELAEACEHTARRLAEERGDPPPWVEALERGVFERNGARTEEAIAGYTAFLSAGGKRPAAFAPALDAAPELERDPLLRVLYTVRDFCRCGQGDPELFATLWTPGRVKLLCLDAASFLRERIRGFHAALFMSATLTPLEFYARTLGADGPASVTLELDSPFPRENRRFLAVDSVDTTYKRRSRDAGKIARIITEAAALRPGNYLAFFSSFAYRDEVVAKMPRGPHRVLLQLPGLPAEATLGLLRGNPGETRILCAVQGGVFAEGVDYPGDMAIGVFVVGPALPAVSPEQELVRSYHERTLGAGFEYAYVYPGLARVVQAGGRSIRSQGDRAFIALLGRRFADPTYRGRLPAYWQHELADTSDPVPLIREFWRGHGFAL